MLYGRYDRMLHGLARSYRLTDSEVDDAVQATWLLLLQHADSIQHPDRVVGWLCTTLRRVCLRTLRDRKRERLECEGGEQQDLVDGAPSPDAHVLQAERDDALWRAVDQLPARQRQLIHVLFEADELSYDEVAIELSMPRGAIGPTRLRALRRLRTMMVASGVEPCDSADTRTTRRTPARLGGR